MIKLEFQILKANKQTLFYILLLKNFSHQYLEVADSGEINTTENFPSLIPVKKEKPTTINSYVRSLKFTSMGKLFILKYYKSIC